MGEWQLSVRGVWGGREGGRERQREGERQRERGRRGSTYIYVGSIHVVRSTDTRVH